MFEILAGEWFDDVVVGTLAQRALRSGLVRGGTGHHDARVRRHLAQAAHRTQGGLVSREGKQHAIDQLVPDLPHPRQRVVGNDALTARQCPAYRLAEVVRPNDQKSRIRAHTRFPPPIPLRG